MHQEMVDFFMQFADLQLRLEIDFIIVFGPQAVFGFLAVLAHHDHRRLDGRETREHQVEQDMSRI